MKQYKYTWFFLLIIFSTALTSCNKVSFPTEDSKKLLGKWQFLTYYGVENGPIGLTTENSIEFTEKGKYYIYKNDVEIRKSNYRLEQRSYVGGGEPVTVILYQMDPNMLQTFEFSGDTLFIHDQKVVGFTYVYLAK